MSDKYTSYVSNAIDTAVLDILDVSKDGKVISAADWVTLWNLVFKSINNIDTYCIYSEELLIDWIQSKTALENTVTTFNEKYDALANNFVHYGETAPTNEHMRFWVKPVETTPGDKLATQAELAGVAAELAHKADKDIIRFSNITLDVDKWSDTAPYRQAVNLTNITANSRVDLTPSPVQLNDFYTNGHAFIIENNNKIITAYCIGNKPTTTYTIPASITEVLT